MLCSLMRCCVSVQSSLGFGVRAVPAGPVGAWVIPELEVAPLQLHVVGHQQQAVGGDVGWAGADGAGVGLRASRALPLGQLREAAVRELRRAAGHSEDELLRAAAAEGRVELWRYTGWGRGLAARLLRAGVGGLGGEADATGADEAGLTSGAPLWNCPQCSGALIACYRPCPLCACVPVCLCACQERPDWLTVTGSGWSCCPGRHLLP